MSQFYAIGRWRNVPAGQYKLRVKAATQGSGLPIFATIHFDSDPFDSAYRTAHENAYPPSWQGMLAQGVDLPLTLAPQSRYQTLGEIVDMAPPNPGPKPWPDREFSFELIDAANQVVPLAQGTDAKAILAMGQTGEIDLRIVSA